jgi:hypothetical protein
VWGPMPDPPNIEPDDDWIQLGGLISVSASDAVREAMGAPLMTQTL